MADANIEWSSIVGNVPAEGKGYVGDLLEVALFHIEKALEANRLTQEYAGEVYTATIAAAMQQGLQFAMTEALTENQIDKAVKDAELSKEKVITEQYAQQVLIATTENEQGKIVTSDGYSYSTNVNNMHTAMLAKAKEEALSAVSERDLMASKVNESKAGIGAMVAKAKSEYGVDINTTYKVYKPDGTEAIPYSAEYTDGYNTVTTTIDGITKVYGGSGGSVELVGYTVEHVVTGVGMMDDFIYTSALDAENEVLNGVPKSQHQASMLKSRVEANVGINTWKGYKADTHFKTYKSLQELFFSLGTANVGGEVDTDSGTNATDPDGTIYKRIINAMELSMNAQTKVWDGTGFVYRRAIRTGADGVAYTAWIKFPDLDPSEIPLDAADPDKGDLELADFHLTAVAEKRDLYDEAHKRINHETANLIELSK